MQLQLTSNEMRIRNYLYITAGSDRKRCRLERFRRRWERDIGAREISRSFCCKGRKGDVYVADLGSGIGFQGW